VQKMTLETLKSMSAGAASMAEAATQPKARAKN
jgi:hypothetical protein